jgi:hypothetical protein
LSILTRVENLVFLCEPNAARFEFHQVDSRILDGFLMLGYNVVMFNYTGYNSADSYLSSLDVE